MLYTLCAGRSLFSDIDASDDNIYKSATAKELMGWSEIDNERLSFVFQEMPDDDSDKIFAKDLIRKCLQGDPDKKRLQTVGDVLGHPYFNSTARDEIIRKDIRVGDTVTVERAGDVIPHILSVDLKKRSKKSLKFIFPKNCPSCGSKTIKEFNKVTKKNDAVRRCSSEDYKCEKISIEKLKHFVSKEAFNIDGLGKKIVEGFWKLKLIQFPQDIFKLDYNKIEKLEGWGRLSVENLQYSINQKKNISLERLIYSLGIRHIGLENAKLLSKHFVSFSKFKSLSIQSDYEDLLNIDGIGETQVNSIKSFFSNKSNIRVLNELEKILIIKNAVQNSDNGLLKNKTFLVTGKLNGISRAEVKSLIEENSGKTISSVSKKLNFLIIGEKPTKKKVDYAKQLKIKVIDQAEFLKMLNKSS